MATRTPLVVNSGDVQQLQSGDPLSPAAVGVLRVVDVAVTLPANTSLVSVDSFTVNNGADFKIPNTSTFVVQNTNHPRFPYWDTIIQTYVDFVTASLVLVDIPGPSFSISANSLYEIECMLVTGSSTTAGIQLGWHGGGSGTEFIADIFVANSTGTNNTLFMPTVDTATSVLSGAAADAVAIIKGFIKTAANGGTITLRVDKITSGTATIYAGSTTKQRKLV